MIKLLKKILKKPYRVIRKKKQIYEYYHIPRKKLVAKVFKKRMGYYPNLENPKTFNEKICWLKINYYSPLCYR